MSLEFVSAIVSGPEGIFGIPHGILSSVDERVAAVLGLVAIAFFAMQKGDSRDARAVAYALVIFGFALAFLPGIIQDEWHVGAIVIAIIGAGAIRYDE